MAAPRRRTRVQNLDKLMAKLEKLPAGVDREVLLELARAAVEIRDGARRRVPVMTGRLRNSIWIWKRGKKFRIGSRSEYARAIEFGTRHSRAQPFLYPAFKEVQPRVRERLVAAINRAEKEVAR